MSETGRHLDEAWLARELAAAPPMTEDTARAVSALLFGVTPADERGDCTQPKSRGTTMHENQGDP